MKKILALCAGFIILTATGYSGTVIYDSSLSDWFSNGLTPTNKGVLILAPYNPNTTYPNATNMLFGQAVGSKSTFPTTTQGDYAGASWTAPSNEVVISFTIYGSYRTDGIGEFTAAVYGGTASDANAEVLLTAGLPVVRNSASNRESYAWTVNIDPSEGITKLQFNAWEALVGVTTNGDGDPWGYSGTIDSIEIVTQAIPESSTVTLGLVGVVILAATSFRRVTASKGLQKQER